MRLFGGWDFEPADANNRMPAAIGYAKGVPMGGDLASAPQGKSPTFIAAALDRLRREAFRRQASPMHDDDAPEARLHVADLVHAVGEDGNSIKSGTTSHYWTAAITANDMEYQT